MIFVLTNVIYIVYDRKNENHWSLLITHYSLLITHYSEYKHPIITSYNPYVYKTCVFADINSKHSELSN